MSKKAIKLLAIVIAIALCIGLVSPLLYSIAFSAPPTETVSEIEAEITRLNSELDTAQKKYEAALALEEKILQDSNTRLQMICENGRLSYLDIIFASKSISDFTDRIVIARELVEYDKNMMDTIKKIQHDAELMAAESKELLAELEKARAEAETENESTVSREQNL